MEDNKIMYGVFDKEGNIKKIKDVNNEFFQILEQENLIKYKIFFILSFENISNILNGNK